MGNARRNSGLMQESCVVDEVRCFLGFAPKKFEGGRRSSLISVGGVILDVVYETRQLLMAFQT